MVKALGYWEQAGEKGDGHSFYNLGRSYENQDDAKALEYYEKADALGYEGAAAKVAELSAKLNG